ADAEPGGEAGLAGEPVVLARHDLEERRLAGTVGAQDADLGSRVERQVDVLQHLAVRRVEPAQLAHGVDELGAHESETSWWGGRVDRRPALGATDWSAYGCRARTGAPPAQPRSR